MSVPLRAELVQHGREGRELPTGIESHVEDQSLDAGVEQLVQHVLKIDAHAAVEVFDDDIADVVIQNAALDGVVLIALAGDGEALLRASRSPSGA